MKRKNNIESKYTKLTEDLKRMHQNAQKEIMDLKKMLKEQQKLKAMTLAWLKDHNVRLGLHQKKMESQQKDNYEMKKMLKEQKELMKNEEKLKAIAFALLKDHQMRLGLHWGEIIKRSV